MDSFSLQPAIGKPESRVLVSESASPTEGIDLALTRFVRCLVGYGASLDIVEAVVLAELSRLRKAVEKKRRRRFDLVGAHLVAAQACAEHDQ